jgi:TolB-like protein/class 3 adenylate cyclase/Tfp pilus assembly protein PilF
MSTDSEPEVRLQIAHVLFLDLVGYSKLLINEQRGRLQTLNQVVRNTKQFCASDANGMLVPIPTGDGMALIFRDSLESPIQCALEISQALKSHPEIQVRMGIHSGPVSEVKDVNEQANIAGAGINIAQRVMDCGDAGHILLSKHVAEDLEHYARWRPLLHDLGECEIKHGAKISVVNLYTESTGNSQLPEKFKRADAGAAVPLTGKSPLNRNHVLIAGAMVAVFVIGLAMFLGPQLWRVAPSREEPRRAATSPVHEKSIAVLPFVDLSQARDQEYFCDGISEEILDALAKIEGLRVVARTSSFSFKGKNVDVGEIAQKLNVQNILEGSLRREGNRIRVTAQLVNARDGFRIWSDSFERDLQGVFAVQDEITRSIVDGLKIKLAVAPPSRPRQNTEAYDVYLQGLYLSNKSDEESLRNSLSRFQQALDIDANFARAWTGIAKAWLWLADAYVRPLEAYPRVKEAASRALALDERDAEAHCYLGETKRILDRDLAGEEAELRRALEIDPNSAPAHLFMALLKTAQGDLAEGVKGIQEAERLDPVAPVICSFAVTIYLAADRIDDAIEAGKRMLRIDPNYVYIEPDLANAYREKGDFQKAIALYEKGQAITHFPSAGLALTYAKMGRHEDARRILDQLIEKSHQQYVAADLIATVYAALGENDEAFRWLERAFDEHSASMVSFTSNPEFRPLRSDPRFADLLRRIGIDPVKVLAPKNRR